MDRIESNEAQVVICTLCSAVPSSGFYTGCMVKDGFAPEWDCDGKGNLTKTSPARHYGINPAQPSRAPGDC